MRALLALIFVLLFAVQAQAAVVRGIVYGTPVGPGAPILNDVGVRFGILTAAGRGNVGFASRDMTTYAFTAKGLDMWDGNTGHTPKKWTIVDNGGPGCSPGACFGIDGTTACHSSYTTPDDTLNPPTPSICTGTHTFTAGADYTFTVTAYDAANNASVPKTLTLTMVDKAVSFGDQGSDYGTTVGSTAKPSFPAAWTTAGQGPPSGAKLLVSTGTNYFSAQAVTDQKRVIIQNKDFQVGQPAVTMEWADATRPGGLWEIELLTVKNFVLSGLTFSGPWKPKSGFYIEIATSSDTITVQDVSILHQVSDVNVLDTASKGLSVLASSNVTVNNFTADYVLFCFNTGLGSTDITFNNSWCRHSYVNFANFGTQDRVTLNDTYFIAPMRYNGQHVDTAQTSNQATPQHLTINRILAVQAEGDSIAQGPIFGGRSGAITGYIDDGVTPGAAGHTLHVVSTVSLNNKVLSDTTSAGNALVSDPDFMSRSIAAGTVTTAACGAAPATCTLGGPSQAIGSVASPANIYTAPITDFRMDGAIYAGGTFNGIITTGEAGTSWIKNFSYVKSNGYNNGEDLATISIPGSIAHQSVSTKTYNLLTATGPTTGNIEGLFLGQDITWDHPTAGKPCNPTPTYPGTGAFAMTCSSTSTYPNNFGPSIAGGTQIGGVDAGLGLTGGPYGGAGLTYQIGCVSGCSVNVTDLGTVASKIFDFRFDFPVDGGPFWQAQYSESTAMHSGTLDVSSGFMWDNLRYLPTSRSGSGTKPANTTITHVFTGDLTANPFPSTHTHDIAQADFNSGDPQVTIDAITTATWAAKTMAQVVRTYAAALAPKVGGDLDAGSGLAWYGAVTPIDDAGEYCWNNGGAWDHTKTCVQNGMTLLSAAP